MNEQKQKEKELILNQYNGNIYLMLCFYYDDGNKLKSIVKPFKKSYYDVVMEFYKKIPTYSELEFFLNSVYIRLDYEIESIKISNVKDCKHYMITFVSDNEISFSVFEDTIVRYKGKDYILTELIKNHVNQNI